MIVDRIRAAQAAAAHGQRHIAACIAAGKGHAAGSKAHTSIAIDPTGQRAAGEGGIGRAVIRASSYAHVASQRARGDGEQARHRGIQAHGSNSILSGHACGVDADGVSCAATRAAIAPRSACCAQAGEHGRAGERDAAYI